MGEPRTTTAANCPDCSLVAAPQSDPVSVLKRLPTKLWNTAVPVVPTVPPLRIGDTIQETSVFGPIAGDDATPQYEISRNFMQERDAFVQGWRQAEARQLGLGDATTQDGQFSSTSPRASGPDLDRLLEQYGVPRPWGFTDCCYWRLYELLLWQPGSTLWLLKEIAELFTGTRPMAIETPAKVVLQWPQIQSPTDPGDSFVGHTFIGHAFVGGTHPAPTTAFRLYVGHRGNVGMGFGFVSSRRRNVSGGMTLMQALRLVKRNGVRVELANMPQVGACGCSGATTRVAATRPGFVGTRPA